MLFEKCDIDLQGLAEEFVTGHGWFLFSVLFEFGWFFIFYNFLVQLK